MQSFLKQIEKDLGKESQDSVMVTVIDTDGSTPRKPGSRLLYREDGSISGSIGGGWIEKRAIGIAKEMLESKEKTHCESFNLNNPNEVDSGQKSPMICGGSVVLFFQCLAKRSS